MAKYLFGASVQGIQSFIFSTNKLTEIMGASEMVELICTKLFFETAFGHNSFNHSTIKNDPNCITAAAGNVKYLFADEDNCKNVVRTFSKMVMEFAPGITISQAVVKIEGNLKPEHLNDLELKLKTQRNKLPSPIQTGLLATERSRRTGAPAVKKEGEDYLDLATLQKEEFGKQKAGYTLANKLFDKDTKLNAENFTFNTDELKEEGDGKSYIAVIHADGNSLGKIIQSLGKSLQNEPSEEKVIKAYKNFSLALDKSTTRAAQTAFNKVYLPQIKENSNKVPLRPIVLGGDDLTMICEAKYALHFTREFLMAFEVETERQFKLLLGDFTLGLDKLTACAGVAFVKAKFPFHYAVHLAEELCGEAKKVSKKMDSKSSHVPASIALHMVESSFFNSYKEIKKQVLMASGVNLAYGPYALEGTAKNMPKLETLFHKIIKLQEPQAPASHLRRWLSALHQNKESANALMDRTIEMLTAKKNEKFVKELGLNTNVGSSTDLYDVVTLSGIIEPELKK